MPIEIRNNITEQTRGFPTKEEFLIKANCEELRLIIRNKGFYRDTAPRKSGTTVTQNEILLQRGPNETRERTARGKVDSSWPVYTTSLSGEWYPSTRFRARFKGRREARRRKENRTRGRIASLFGRVSDNTHTVWRVPKGIDNAPLPLTPSPYPRDFTPILMQIGVSYGAVRPPPSLPHHPSPPLGSYPGIEITLIYCGTERLPRSIIRLSS